MNDIGMTARIRIDTDRAGKLVLTTPDIKYPSCRRIVEPSALRMPL